LDKKREKKSRRDFLTNIFMGGGLFASLALFVHHVIKFIFPPIKDTKLRKLLVGRIDELKLGEAKEFNIGDRSLFLVNTSDGYKVLSAICTHLGCKIKWEGHRDRFYCPCHQGIFSPSGDVVEGPPPRPLEEYKVVVDKNLVYMWLEENVGGLV